MANKCDKCEFKGPTVHLGDHCPECGQLVGFPVPNKSSPAHIVEAYDVEATDEALAAAMSKIAQRNFDTLIRRKRKSEAEAGFAAPAAEADDEAEAEASGTDSPPNADPSAAVDPSVQPQPDGGPADNLDSAEST